MPPPQAIPSPRPHHMESGDGIPIIFLGGPAGDRAWEAQRRLFSRHLRCIELATPEHLQALIAQLDLAPAHLVGLGEGAVAALRLALGQPQMVRSLTLVSPPQGGSTLPDRPAMPEGPSGHPVAGPARPPEKEALQLDLARMGLPTLVVAGDGDDAGIEAAVALKRGIPGAALLVLPRCGDMPHLDAPEAFNRALQDLLAATDSGGWSAGPLNPTSAPPVRGR